MGNKRIFNRRYELFADAPSARLFAAFTLQELEDDEVIKRHSELHRLFTEFDFQESLNNNSVSAELLQEFRDRLYENGYIIEMVYKTGKENTPKLGYVYKPEQSYMLITITEIN